MAVGAAPTHHTLGGPDEGIQALAASSGTSGVVADTADRLRAFVVDARGAVQWETLEGHRGPLGALASQPEGPLAAGE